MSPQVNPSDPVVLSFVLGRDLASKAIAWFSAGPFSHVDAVLASGWRLGARSDVVTVGGVGYPAGVQIRPPNYEQFQKEVRLTIPCTDEQTLIFWRFNQAQIGLPYDHTAIWGFAAGRDWREPNAWFCSEQQQAALEECRYFYPVEYNKVTPYALYNMCLASGASQEVLS